jgi:hypothetical protein
MSKTAGNMCEIKRLSESDYNMSMWFAGGGSIRNICEWRGVGVGFAKQGREAGGIPFLSAKRC